MGLFAMHTLLKHAKEHGYGVPAYNMWNLESVKAAIEVAEEEDSPVILQGGGWQLKWGDIETWSAICHSQAIKTRVPVAIHLDHSPTYDLVLQALRNGFTSVMLDASLKPYEENVRLTRMTAEAAHVSGVTAEGEIGHVGQGAEKQSDEQEAAWMTDPDQAAQFVKDTGIDAVAVAIGNQHGLYSYEPKLDFDRLAAIARATDAYIVMHGGTGTPGLDRAVRLGVQKVNVGTDVRVAFIKALKDNFDQTPFEKLALDIPGVLTPARKAMKEVMRSYMRMFGCSGMAQRLIRES